MQAQIDFILGPMGLTPREAKLLVLSAPEMLAEKDFELERKWRFIQVKIIRPQSRLRSSPNALPIFCYC